jgi:hypothetical protein
VRPLVTSYTIHIRSILKLTETMVSGSATHGIPSVSHVPPAQKITPRRSMIRRSNRRSAAGYRNPKALLGVPLVVLMALGTAGFEIGDLPPLERGEAWVSFWSSWVSGVLAATAWLTCLWWRSRRSVKQGGGKETRLRERRPQGTFANTWAARSAVMKQTCNSCHVSYRAGA